MILVIISSFPDKSPSCPAADEGNGYCRGFHDGWRKTVLDILN